MRENYNLKPYVVNGNGVCCTCNESRACVIWSLFINIHSIDFQINSVLIPDCEIGQKTIQQLVGDVNEINYNVPI